MYTLFFFVLVTFTHRTKSCSVIQISSSSSQSAHSSSSSAPSSGISSAFSTTSKFSSSQSSHSSSETIGCPSSSHSWTKNSSSDGGSQSPKSTALALSVSWIGISLDTPNSLHCPLTKPALIFLVSPSLRTRLTLLCLKSRSVENLTFLRSSVRLFFFHV